MIEQYDQWLNIMAGLALIGSIVAIALMATIMVYLWHRM